jgi:hypothetical protein
MIIVLSQRRSHIDECTNDCGGQSQEPAARVFHVIILSEAVGHCQIKQAKRDGVLVAGQWPKFPDFV